MVKMIKDACNNKNLVPCLGAGLSCPFSMPSWRELIIQISDNLIDNSVDRSGLLNLLDTYRYMDAVSFIKDILSLGMKREKIEFIIQNEVAEIIDQHQNKSILNGLQNDNTYIDLMNIGFAHYFTFNYDCILEALFEKSGQVATSRVLKDYDMNTQFMNDHNSSPIIWHLHGDYHKAESIILSKKSYESLYSNQLFKSKLEFFVRKYVFLFLGFSFNDDYVKQFFKLNKDIFKYNQHFILLPNGSDVDERMLQCEYGLHVLMYDISNGYEVGIRNKLKELGLMDEYQKTDEINRKPSIHIGKIKNMSVIKGNHGIQINNFH